MAGNLQVLVDSISEGLLIVSPDGVVRLTNQAATELFPVIIGKRFPAEEVLVQISAASRGYVRLPFEFEINAPGSSGTGDRLRLKLLDSPVATGYMIMVRNVSEAARYETILSNFSNIMAVELGQPMKDFAEKVSELLREAIPDAEHRSRLSGDMRVALRQGEQMVGNITQLATFAQVLSKSPILAADRIPALELVSGLVERVRPLMEKRSIKLNVVPIGEELPVVYGSRDWLVEALFGYIEHMVMNCNVRSDLELQMRPYGNFVSLQIRNHGRSHERPDDKRSVRPAGQAKPGNAKEPAGLQSLGLGMALCRHIVELHRGNMRLTDEDGDITAFVLELPAGAPPESINPSLGADQARRYAEDLTRLMQRQRRAQTN